MAHGESEEAARRHGGAPRPRRGLQTLVAAAVLVSSCEAPPQTGLAPPPPAVQRFIADSAPPDVRAEAVELAVPAELRVDLDGDARPAVVSPPESALEWRLGVGERGRLELAVAALGGAPGSAAALAVDVAVDGAPPVRRVSGSAASGAGWEEHAIDLAEHAGREISVWLRNESPPGGPTLLWGNPTVVSGRPREAIDVVFISIDTLRPDHLSVYGYHRPTSPWLDAWSERRAVVFENAIAQSPWTLPSHVSMLTGLDAFRHGVNHPQPAPASLELLQETLRDAGWATLAVTGGSFLRPDFGLAQGFDELAYWTGRRNAREELSSGVDEALRRAARYRDRPLFLFFHTFETHDPYLARQPYYGTFADGAGDDAYVMLRSEPRQPDDGFVVRRHLAVVDLDRRVGARLPPEMAGLAIDRYDSSVAYVDAEIGRLLDGLAELRDPDRTVVVFTSDHGELFGEHGVAGHAYFWEENVKVPLAMALPEGRAAGRRVETQVRSIDIVPTVLELAGLPVDAGLDGRSLLDLADGRRPPGPREAWIYAGRPNPGLAIRSDNRAKMVFSNRAWGPPRDRLALYDLVSDPGESRDLADGDVAAGPAQRAREILAEHIASARLELFNHGEREIAGRLSAEMIDHFTVKSSDLDCTCLEWLEPGRAAFRVPPGRAYSLYFEQAAGVLMTIELDAADGGPPAVFERRLDEGFTPLSVGRDGDRWLETGSLDGEADAGLKLWLFGDVDDDAADFEIEASLQRQLRALGYID